MKRIMSIPTKNATRPTAQQSKAIQKKTERTEKVMLKENATSSGSSKATKKKAEKTAKVEATVVEKDISSNEKTTVTTNQTLDLKDLEPKLQQEILDRLDFHTLLKCRLLSKNLKVQVDEKLISESVLPTYRIHTWNPYFTVRPYYDLDASNILGLIRLESAAAVKRFVEENSKKGAKSTEDSATPSLKKKTGPPSKASSFTTQVRPLWKPAGGKPNNLLTSSTSSRIKPTINTQSAKNATQPSSSTSAKTPKAASTKALPSFDGSGTPQSNSTEPLSDSTFESSSNISLFPHGAVHIRRRLQDYVEEYRKASSPAADTTAEVILWTNHLVRKFGEQITSFTYDDGKRKGSDLSFKQLGFIISQLPNLVNLGISSGNYEHYSFEDNVSENGHVEKFPPHANLKYVWLGYNVTYHLHMDILNAYGCQLKRLICSKFGVALISSILVGDIILTTNSFQKLLDYVYSIRGVYPDMLSSLEELKITIISTQNLMQEIESGSDDPMRWSNLKRLSLHYTYRPDNKKNSDFADVFLFLNEVAPTLEELYLNFDLCSEFIEWLSEEDSPLTRDVYQPCLKLRKFCISANSLLRFLHVAKMISLKFPNLEGLAFYNWWMYHAEASQNGFEGNYFSGGPKTLSELDLCMVPFWKTIPTLNRTSVRIGTWKTEAVYSKTRREVDFPF